MFKNRRERVRAVPWRAVGAAIAVGAIATMVGVSGAAGSTKRHAVAQKALGTLIMRNQADWDSFDAYVDAGRSTNFAYISPGYDKLISLGPNGGNDFVPYLATSWTQKAKVITFKLRGDAKCTDGHILNAQDVQNSVQRFLDVPKRSGSASSGPIGGFGPGPYHLSSNIKTRTFTFASDKPWRNLIATFAQFPIICPSGLQQLQSDPHWLETHIAGSGPYTLVSAKHGDSVVWQRRDDWHWGPPGANVKNMPQTVIMRVVADETTAANLLLTGGLTAAIVSGPDTTRLDSTTSLWHTNVLNYTPTFLAFNQRSGRLLATDQGVRQALALAVDPKQFNQATYNGIGTISPTIIRPGAECFDKKIAATVPKPNVDKAKQVLAQDGWQSQGGKLVKNGQTLSLTLVTPAQFAAGSEYVRDAIAALGINVNWQNLSTSAYGQAVLSTQYDVAIARTTTALPNAGLGQGFFTGPTSPAGFNVGGGGATDPLFLRLSAAAYENPGQGGCKYWALVQKQIISNSYVDPLVAPNLRLYSPKGIYMPPYSPDQSAYPIYYVRPKRS